MKKKLKKYKKQAKEEEKKSIKKKVKRLKKKLKKIKKEQKKDAKRIKKTQQTRAVKKNTEKNHIKTDSTHGPDSKTAANRSSRRRSDVVENGSASMIGPSVDLMTSQATMTPMTREEWEKQEGVVRRVYDPETGRSRLIKGSGEVLEECVSRDRHRAINKSATQSDGEFFQANAKSRASKP